MNELNMWTGSRFPLLENKKNGEKGKKAHFLQWQWIWKPLLVGDKAHWLVQKHITNASNVKQKIDSLKTVL